MRTSCLSLVVLLGFAASAVAQDETKSMFSETSHDFGTVARGAKVEYKFTIENRFEEDAHISACYSSCECTTPQLDKRTIKTWEKAELTAVVNTKDFYGPRDVTITLKFDPPFSEVQVHIHAHIRSDVVVQPEAVQFGTVKLGSALQRRVRISYKGRSDWKIVRVESGNPGARNSTRGNDSGGQPGGLRFDRESQEHRAGGLHQGLSFSWSPTI